MLMMLIIQQLIFYLRVYFFAYYAFPNAFPNQFPNIIPQYNLSIQFINTISQCWLNSRLCFYSKFLYIEKSWFIAEFNYFVHFIYIVFMYFMHIIDIVDFFTQNCCPLSILTKWVLREILIWFISPLIFCFN